MYISNETTALDIANEYAHPMTADLRQKLAEAIEDYAIIRVEHDAREKFQTRLRRQAKASSENWHIGKHEMELFEEVADRLPAQAKANLIRLSYADILELKKIHEGGVFNELKDWLKSEVVDRVENEPLDLDSLLSTLDEVPGDKFTRLLKQNKISKDRATKVLEALKEEYKVVEQEEELS